MTKKEAVGIVQQNKTNDSKTYFAWFARKSLIMLNTVDSNWLNYLVLIGKVESKWGII